MRRALDAAKSKLASLSDRDAILDCFFDHSRHLFQFAVLFIVRGDTAYGRNVHGVGAPDGLVTRLAFPLNEPGLLSRARDLRRPFIASSAMGAGDLNLFGSLGRAMPAGLVVPVVVRDRVVAIFLADGPAQALNQRATEAGRPALELTKEEMLLWAQSVGEALEHLILRLKGTGSVPPPRGAAPGAPPEVTIPRPAPLPSIGDALPSPFASAFAPEAEEPTSEATREAASDERPRRYVLIALAAAAVLILGGAALWLTRPLESERVVLAGNKLAGWPSAVDPATVLDAARSASGLGSRAELAVVQAEVARGGKIDFTHPAKNPDSILLGFVFVTADSESEVRVDMGGMRAPATRARPVCDNQPCRPVVPAPKCTFAQIWESSVPAGLLDGDQALLAYTDGRSQGPEGAPGPAWFVSVAGRGRIRLDPATCKPLAGERLLPAAVPVSAIPGAPREVDPLALVPLARTQSGLDADAILLEIDAQGVRRNGRIDLGAGDSVVTYIFSDPPAATRKVRRWREVKLTKDGMPTTSTVSDRTTLPSRLFGTVPPPPLCSFAHAYTTVATVPGDTAGLARVVYGPDTASPRSGVWTIEIPALGTRRTVSDGECVAWENLSKKK